MTESGAPSYITSACSPWMASTLRGMAWHIRNSLDHSFGEFLQLPDRFRDGRFDSRGESYPQVTDAG